MRNMRRNIFVVKMDLGSADEVHSLADNSLDMLLFFLAKFGRRHLVVKVVADGRVNVVACETDSQTGSMRVANNAQV